MIASLPMYDRPETRPAWDRFWQHIKAEAVGLDLPEHLTWGGGDAEHWLRPDLALSQTCSLPYRKYLHGKVALLGALDFGLPGCKPGFYNSVVVMRKDDPRHAQTTLSGLTLAYNASDSQSGWAAPYFHLQNRGFNEIAGVETGAHHASALAVAESRADIAALDAQTYRLLCRYEPIMTQLVDVCRTEPTPSLPLICGPEADADQIWSAVETAFDNRLTSADKARLDLQGVTRFTPDEYVCLPIPPEPSEVWTP